MGCFFVNQYDLFTFVNNDVGKEIGGLSRSVQAATGEDLTQDIKDSCTLISEGSTYDRAFEDVNSLFDFLEDKIGIV